LDVGLLTIEERPLRESRARPLHVTLPDRLGQRLSSQAFALSRSRQREAKHGCPERGEVCDALDHFQWQHHSVGSK